MSEHPEIEFQAFPKIARWNREVVVTEKIDGTNAAVGVMEDGRVYAQSRKRLITPETDNHGFAKWVMAHADELRDGLGPGLHFGEWWGKGVMRNYGLDDNRFSLFNVSRWHSEWWNDHRCIECQCCFVVPILEIEPTPDLIDTAEILSRLAVEGSFAAPGFMKPEGIVIYHGASNTLFKATIENDDTPKSVVKERENAVR